MMEILPSVVGEGYTIGTCSPQTVNGRGENDYLNGNSGNNTLKGGTGDDIMYGGQDNDTHNDTHTNMSNDAPPQRL